MNILFILCRFQNEIKFRQLTDGKHLLQLIYVNETIRDCEIVDQRDQARLFLNEFKHDLSQLVSTSNLTLDSLDNNTLPEDVNSWLDFKTLRKKCKHNHVELKKALNSIKKKEKQKQLTKLR